MSCALFLFVFVCVCARACAMNVHVWAAEAAEEADNSLIGRFLSTILSLAERPTPRKFLQILADHHCSADHLEHASRRLHIIACLYLFVQGVFFTGTLLKS